MLPFLQERSLDLGDRDSSSHLAQVDFCQKDPTSWNIVIGGAIGKMKYNRFNGELDFIFNGQGLEPGLAYSLVYNPGAEYYGRIVMLGSTEADAAGNVHLAGSMAVSELMQDYEKPDAIGLWLVLSAEVDIGDARMKDWNPHRYLFGHDVFTIGDEVGV